VLRLESPLKHRIRCGNCTCSVALFQRRLRALLHSGPGQRRGHNLRTREPKSRNRNSRQEIWRRTSCRSKQRAGKSPIDGITSLIQANSSQFTKVEMSWHASADRNRSIGASCSRPRSPRVAERSQKRREFNSLSVVSLHARTCIFHKGLIIAGETLDIANHFSILDANAISRHNYIGALRTNT
jgi:hypothetical protein